ncbi:MAG: glycoside hydrolase family 88 protein, partial [Bacteroidales bacterium]|nr:glycoside hydrolase family 88 protein [Bacteroidales bacterium]
MTLHKIILVSAAALSVAACSSGRKLSLEMVRSEMGRCETAAHLDGMEGKLKWNYTTGLELKAFLDVHEACGKEAREDIFTYAENWYDSIIDENGNIQTYRLDKYNTDHVCPGRTLFYLYEKTGKAKYRTAIDTLRSQLDTHPRTSEGGFWHKQAYPWQMWLDGLYMAQPFYAEYNARFGNNDPEVWADIVNHFEVVATHTFDPGTGLYRHAWDESREMFWCDKLTGQSDHAWGRALGWYAMAIVEA